MVCQATGGLGSCGGAGNLPPTRPGFLLKWHQTYRKSSRRNILGKNLKAERRDILLNASVWELAGKRGSSYEKKKRKKDKAYEKGLKEAKQQNLLLIMLLQLLLVCRWLVLENILYYTCSEYTPQIIAKGKFGGYGMMWLRKPENYHQGRAKNSQETHSLVLHLSFPYSSAGWRQPKRTALA